MNKIEFLHNIDKYKGEDHSTFLQHYGILGQKWGQRRWQNPDGTFNEAGKERYFGQPKRNPKGTVFISGSSKTQFDDNEFYRKNLPGPIQNKIKEYMKQGKTILVGDAPGIDRQVQDFLKANNYKDVEVYSPGKQTRYSANPEWKVNHVDVPNAEEGSGEWLRGKDEAMTERATEGLAITIEDGAQATRNNIDRLKSQDKSVNVFELKKDGNDNWTENNEDKIGGLYKMSPWEKKSEKNRKLDLMDEYEKNKKSMSKEEFKQWKEDTIKKERQIKLDKEEFAKLQDLKEKIAKGKKLSEKEYNKLSEEGKKIYDASKEMKENGWDIESKKDNPDSKYTQKVDLVFTKKLDNKDFGDKFTVYQKDLKDIKGLNDKANKAMEFLNKKDSYNKIVNDLLEQQYKYYQDVSKRENRKNIMTKSEFFESEKPYVKEVGFDTWGGGDGSIGIDFVPKNPNTFWFGYGFEVWVDPSTGKVTDYYQS